MKRNFCHNIVIAAVLICGGGGGTLFADVKAYASSDGYKVELENKTNSAWIMGGVRFKNGGQDLKLQYGDATIRKTSGNEYDVYQKSTQPQHAKLLAPERRQDVANFQPPLWGQPTEPYKIDDSSLEVLLRTGAPGIPEDPDEEKPNTLDELRELVKKSDFYDPNYRLQKPDGKGGTLRYYDSLGVNGGLYSGGFMDTYLGETQLHFAIPKGNITGVWSEGRVARGSDEPLYWLSMGIIQEYFRVDNQWIFSVGAKETGIGLMNHTPESNLSQAGVYGWWQIERDAGLDKFLAYPQFFPKYETILTNAGVVALIPNVGEIMDYYMRGNLNYSPKASALIFNSAFCSAIFQYVMYDALSYSNDACWKFALGNAVDPYMALAAMNLIYNTGEFGTAETIKNAFSNANIDALVNDPNANQIFEGGYGGYTSQIRAVVQQLINASKDFELDGGNNSELIDFEITLEQLRQIFFGDNGTAANQGNGGVLLHFYDPTAGKDVTAMRQKIWNTLGDAFDICKGLSPTTRGKNTISYRYDFLSVLRTVKEDIPFVRRLNFAGNMGTVIPDQYDKGKNPCGKDAGAGDELYPYATVDIDSEEEFCSVEVKMEDENLCGKVKWSIDYDWTMWNNAEMVESAPAKKNTFKFEIRRETAEALMDRNDGSGEFVWIMAEDAAGNSVVVKREISFVSRPKIKWAAVYDTDGDGYPDSLKAEIIGEGLPTNLAAADYSWSWGTGGSKQKIEDGINRVKISANGKFLTVTGLDSQKKGAGDGKDSLYLICDSLDIDGKKTNSKINISGAIKDSCGPAIKDANFYPSNKKTGQYDTLIVEFTENIVQNGKKLIFADKTPAKNLKDVEADKVERISDDKYRFLYSADKITGSDGILLYDSVKIYFEDKNNITDKAQNPPAQNNRLVKITDNSINRKYFDFEVKNVWYFDTSTIADGYVDLIKVKFNFDFGKYENFAFNVFISDIQKMFSDEFNEDKFNLRRDRMFNSITESDVKVISEDLLQIAVSQKKDDVSAKTSTEGERFSMDYEHPLRFSDTLGIRARGDFQIGDSIAPIITHGFYSPMALESDVAEIIDNLEIHFSEQISGGIHKDAINAYSLAERKEYYFNFEETRISGNSATVSVKYENASILPQQTDSIRIRKSGFEITDRNGVPQKNTTVYAPLGVGTYMSNYDVLIYPNPYTFGEFETTDKKTGTNPVIERFALGNTGTKNMAVVIRTKGQRGLAQKLSGSIEIFDALGNAIVEKEDFSQGKEGALIWTWNGKNKRNRTVGAGIYQAIIRVNNETENNTVVFSRKIGIKK